MRVTTPILRQEAWLKKQEEKQQNCQLLKDEKSVSQKKRSKKASRAAPNHIVGLEGGTKIDKKNFFSLLRKESKTLTNFLMTMQEYSPLRLLSIKSFPQLEMPMREA